MPGALLRGRCLHRPPHLPESTDKTEKASASLRTAALFRFSRRRLFSRVWSFVPQPFPPWPQSFSAAICFDTVGPSVFALLYLLYCSCFLALFLMLTICGNRCLNCFGIVASGKLSETLVSVASLWHGLGV